MYEGRFVQWFKRRLAKYGQHFIDNDEMRHDFNLHELLKLQEMEPFLEYVAHSAASRSVRRLEAKQTIVMLRKLLQELLNEDVSSTVLSTI